MNFDPNETTLKLDAETRKFVVSTANKIFEMFSNKYFIQPDRTSLFVASKKLYGPGSKTLTVELVNSPLEFLGLAVNTQNNIPIIYINSRLKDEFTVSNLINTLYHEVTHVYDKDTFDSEKRKQFLIDYPNSEITFGQEPHSDYYNVPHEFEAFTSGFIEEILFVFKNEKDPKRIRWLNASLYEFINSDSLLPELLFGAALSAQVNNITYVQFTERNRRRFKIRLYNRLVNG